jgi:hypothetical protein
VMVIHSAGPIPSCKTAPQVNLVASRFLRRNVDVDRGAFHLADGRRNANRRCHGRAFTGIDEICDPNVVTTTRFRFVICLYVAVASVSSVTVRLSSRRPAIPPHSSRLRHATAEDYRDDGGGPKVDNRRNAFSISESNTTMKMARNGRSLGRFAFNAHSMSVRPPDPQHEL